VLYVGSTGGVEEQLVTRSGLPFAAVEAGGLHGLSAATAAKNVIKLARGVREAWQLGRRERPDAVFATGGYASVPPAVAAWLLRAPILVYLPDIEPGLAVRFIARLARRVAVTTAESGAYFAKRKVVVTGYPIRPELAVWDKASAKDELGLAPDELTLLVLGGSRGAKSINQALGGVLEQVLSLMQVIHVSGELDWPQVAARRDALPAGLQARYHASGYLHEEMGAALAAADLAVCRSGASVLGELALFGLPALLVPYPHAWRYQRTNAEWLASRGAAQIVPDQQLADRLLPTVRELVEDRSQLAAMAERSRRLARPDAAKRLAEELVALAAA